MASVPHSFRELLPRMTLFRAQFTLRCSARKPGTAFCKFPASVGISGILSEVATSSTIVSPRRLERITTCRRSPLPVVSS